MIKSTVFRHMVELGKRGVISYIGKTLTFSLQIKMRVMFRRIPYSRHVVCVMPDEHEEHITGYLAAPEEYIKQNVS